MGEMNVCKMGTRVGLSFLKGSGTNNSVSELIWPITYYIVCTFLHGSQYI